MEPSREEPVQLPPEHGGPEEAPGPSQQDTTAEDPVPRYLGAADEEEWAIIRAELISDTGKPPCKLLCSRVAGVSLVKPLLLSRYLQS